MATSNTQSHLRKYIDDGIQQKLRLGTLIQAYKDQQHKTQERIIDGKTLEANLTAKGIDPVKVAQVKDRGERDVKVLEIVKRSLGETQEEMEGLTLRMNAHLEELTDIEILTGGFVTHAVGTGKDTTFDRLNKIIRFKDGGHAEVPIAVRLNKWKDSSQLTIKKITEE